MKSPEVVKLIIDNGLISTVEDVEFILRDATTEERRAKAKLVGHLLGGVEVHVGELKNAAQKVARKLAQEETGKAIRHGWPYPKEIKQWLREHAQRRKV